VYGPRIVQAAMSHTVARPATNATGWGTRHFLAAQHTECTVTAAKSTGPSQLWPAKTLSSPEAEAIVSRTSAQVAATSYPAVSACHRRLVGPG